MGRGWLWALDKRGVAYRLSASLPVSQDNDLSDQDGVNWQKMNCEVRLRKLAASLNYAWAVGSNSKPYLFVYSADCPCRVTEEVYENQRWYPLTGFTSHLLPNDREVWTDASGNADTSPQNRRLPSFGWEWEDPWEPDCNERLVDKEGWMYASNFTRSYSNHHFSTAFVRRRKWLRTRRYTAVDKWVKIGIPSRYAIMDIAVGGLDVPGQSSGFLCVWALTSKGRVLFRQGINRFKPEGDVWFKIDIPDEVEFNQLSCSPSTGALWTVSWEGRLFCRKGQAKTDYIGTGWCELPAPSPELRFLNVALGDRVAWAITMDGRAWFARLNTDNPDQPIFENSWLDMTCSMSHLSLGPMDHVFGIGLVDDTIYYRTDITEKELSGRTWQPVLTQVLRPEEEDVIEFTAEGVANAITVFDGHQKSNSFLRRALAPSGVLTCVPLVVKYRRTQTNGHIAKIGDENTGLQLENDDEETDKESAFSEDVAQSTTGASDSVNEDVEIDSQSSQIANQPPSTKWFHVNAGGCLINQSINDNGPPKCWFELNPRALSNRSRMNDFNASWRQKILCDLTERNIAIWSTFSDFALAFEKDTWTRTVSMQIYSSHQKRWLDLILQLTQSWHQSDPGENRCGLFLKFMGTNKKEYQGKTGLVCLNDVLCVRREFEFKSNKFVMILYVSKINADPGMHWDFPLKFVCKSEDDQKSWAHALDEAAMKCQHPFKAVSASSVASKWPNSIWAVSHNGAVYVCEPGQRCLIKDLYWHSLGGHFKAVESGMHDIVWALGNDGRLWTHAHCAMTIGQHQEDIEIDEVYENQRWSRFLLKYVPIPRFMSGAYYAWSDNTGRIDRPKESFKLPGSDWQWLHDWRIEFSSNYDSDGWQYSKSFKHPFVALKKFSYSDVRRRKWTRRRRITDTNGTNWRLVEPGPGSAGHPLFTRVVVQSNHQYPKIDQILVFAITTDGDLLCRLGVTVENPNGHTWRHVRTDLRVIDVSLGCDFKLWIVAENGYAYCCYSANPEDLLCSGWREILPPQTGKSRLRKIAVGDYAVYALDGENRLHFRIGVRPWCPEGVCWITVPSNTANIEQISVSRDNQIWALLKSTSPTGSLIARRYDIRGYGDLWDIDWWDISLADGWAYISACNHFSGLCKRKDNCDNEGGLKTMKSSGMDLLSRYGF